MDEEEGLADGAGERCAAPTPAAFFLREEGGLPLEPEKEGAVPTPAAFLLRGAAGLPLAAELAASKSRQSMLPAAMEFFGSRQTFRNIQ